MAVIRMGGTSLGAVGSRSASSYTASRPLGGRTNPQDWESMESTTITPEWGSQQTGLFDWLQGQLRGVPDFNFNQYLTQAFKGPYFKTVSSGLLGALAPQFAKQQQGLGDMFRNFGMENSSMFGQGMSGLMGEQAAQQGGLLSALARDLLASSLQAGQLNLQTAMAPIQAGVSLFGQLPFGQTTTQNVNMPNMMNLLNTLRQAQGGNLGGTNPYMTMPQFQQAMQPRNLGGPPQRQPGEGTNYPGTVYGNPGNQWYGGQPQNPYGYPDIYGQYGGMEQGLPYEDYYDPYADYADWAYYTGGGQ